MIPAHIPPHNLKELIKAEIITLSKKNLKNDFEIQVKKYLNTNNYIMTSSGRQALYLALKNSGISKGDEVILPAFTTDIVPMVVREAGAIPIPADVELDSYNISSDSILDRITNKTKAILTVHTYGNPSNINVIKEICKDHDLCLIEDAAPAFGAIYCGRPAGTFGDFGVFSFGLGKSISMGGGGGLVVSDNDIYEKIELRKKHKGSISTFIKIMGSIILSNPSLYGALGYRIKDQMVAHEYDKYKDEVLDAGDNPSLCYSLGLLGLTSMIIEKRRSIAEEYRGIIKNHGNMHSQQESKGSKSVYTRFFMRTEDEKVKNKIYKSMKYHRIEPLVPDMGYPISKDLYPIEWQDKIKNSDILSKTLIGFPVYRKIPENVLEEILNDASVA